MFPNSDPAVADDVWAIAGEQRATMLPISAIGLSDKRLDGQVISVLRVSSGLGMEKAFSRGFAWGIPSEFPPYIRSQVRIWRR